MVGAGHGLFDDDAEIIRQVRSLKRCLDVTDLSLSSTHHILADVAILLDTCDVQVIYFNDRKLIRRFAKVRHSRGHNDHLHMRVRAPKAKRVQSSRAPAPAGDVAKR